MAGNATNDRMDFRFNTDGQIALFSRNGSEHYLGRIFAQKLLSGTSVRGIMSSSLLTQVNDIS